MWPCWLQTRADGREWLGVRVGPDALPAGRRLAPRCPLLRLRQLLLSPRHPRSQRDGGVRVWPADVRDTGVAGGRGRRASGQRVGGGGHGAVGRGPDGGVGGVGAAASTDGHHPAGGERGDAAAVAAGGDGAADAVGGAAAPPALPRRGGRPGGGAGDTRCRTRPYVRGGAVGAGADGELRADGGAGGRLAGVVRADAGGGDGQDGRVGGGGVRGDARGGAARLGRCGGVRRVVVRHRRRVWAAERRATRDAHPRQRLLPAARPLGRRPASARRRRRGDGARRRHRVAAASARRLVLRLSAAAHRARRAHAVRALLPRDVPTSLAVRARRVSALPPAGDDRRRQRGWNGRAEEGRGGCRWGWGWNGRAGPGRERQRRWWEWNGAAAWRRRCREGRCVWEQPEGGRDFECKRAQRECNGSAAPLYERAEARYGGTTATRNALAPRTAETDIVWTMNASTTATVGSVVCDHQVVPCAATDVRLTN